MGTDPRASAVEVLTTAVRATFSGELMVQEDLLRRAVSLLSSEEKRNLTRSWSRRALAHVADTRPDAVELEGLRQVLEDTATPDADGEALKQRLWQLDTSKSGPQRTDTLYTRYLHGANSVARSLETAFPMPWTDENESTEDAQSRTTVECFFCTALASPSPAEEADQLFKTLAEILRA